MSHLVGNIGMLFMIPKLSKYPLHHFWRTGKTQHVWEEGRKRYLSHCMRLQMNSIEGHAQNVRQSFSSTATLTSQRANTTMEPSGVDGDLNISSNSKSSFTTHRVAIFSRTIVLVPRLLIITMTNGILALNVIKRLRIPHSWNDKIKQDNQLMLIFCFLKYEITHHYRLYYHYH